MADRTRLTQRDDVAAYVTKDGSEIRELMHPDHHASVRQSLAEATVPPGGKTVLHRHGQTEELYFVIEGEARMYLGEESFPMTAGDTVCIAPGTPHCIENCGEVPLRFLCCCTPPYSHGDTELLP